ncbi:MAG: hypothetical protein KKH51_11820 [Actinobacteria bacterium]|nr:hypothetical protein [Actinomycetota bacterium]
MPTTMPAPTAHDIRLDVISMNEWRVCDRRVPQSDSSCVLGFIERRGFEYEVISVLQPGPVRSFGSLASATLSFSE